MVTMAGTPDAVIVQRPAGSTVDAIVARAGLFDTVAAAAVAAVINQLLPVHFSHRQIVYAEGEPGEQLYIIASGKVKLGRRRADGRRHLLAIVGTSGMFGELSIFDPGPRTSTATALTDVSTDVAGRTAKQLLQLAQQFGIQEHGTTRVNHDLTQEDLGQLIGASRETVNKVLTDFTQRGWIRHDDKSLVIIDSERLAQRTSLTAAPQLVDHQPINASSGRSQSGAHHGG